MNGHQIEFAREMIMNRAEIEAAIPQITLGNLKSYSDQHINPGQFLVAGVGWRPVWGVQQG